MNSWWLIILALIVDFNFILDDLRLLMKRLINGQLPRSIDIIVSTGLYNNVREVRSDGVRGDIGALVRKLNNYKKKMCWYYTFVCGTYANTTMAFKISPSSAYVSIYFCPPPPPSLSSSSLVPLYSEFHRSYISNNTILPS